MTYAGAIGLQIVLVLAGIFIGFTGVNLAFGGIRTLGWQGQAAFFEVTNQPAYLVQDNHIRFLGGLWTGIGLLFIVAATNLQKYESAWKVAFVFIFLGGLARFSQMQMGIIFGKDIAGSLVAELVGMPLLYFWLSRTIGKGQKVMPGVSHSPWMAI